MYLYAFDALRVSVGVLRVYRCKYSLAIAFNLCAPKFCSRARIRSARKTPGEVRPDSIAGKPAQRYIRHLCNMPAIRNRSAQTISTRPDSPRNISPKISRPVEIRKTGIKIVKSWNFRPKSAKKIFDGRGNIGETGGRSNPARAKFRKSKIFWKNSENYFSLVVAIFYNIGGY